MSKKKTLSVFAKNLKKLREEKNLSQSELGEKVGVSRGSISFYENDDRIPDMIVLRELKNILDVDYEYLLGETPYRNINQKKTTQENIETLQKAISNSNVDNASNIVELLRLILETSEKTNVADITLPTVAEMLADILNILVAYTEKSVANPAALLVYERFNSMFVPDSTQDGKEFTIKAPLESWLQDFTYMAGPLRKDIQQKADNYISALQTKLFDTAKANTHTAICDISLKLTEGWNNNGND